jgi:plasmid stabilization system protein ParE
LIEESQNTALRHRFYAAFEKSCLPYERRPKLSRLLHLPGGTEPVRRFLIEGFPKYLVLYREIEGGILIVRVLHGMSDLPLLVNERRPS